MYNQTADLVTLTWPVSCTAVQLYFIRRVVSHRRGCNVLEKKNEITTSQNTSVK